ncbi:hypothetical protein [Roseomonas elaeocarpi]|uniref:Glycosyl hydrolase family 32 N-terminal domain-containing protein n=1 Tax=Roseomonas elaeocarpi TaxID=907779 RepID=A0ABV6JQA8_9PROT
MTALSGTNVAAPLSPFDSADTFPTHDEQYGKGGYRAVAAVADRDAIPSARRSDGMQVFVRAERRSYRLAADLTTWEDAQNTTPSEVAAAVSSGVSAAVTPLQQQLNDLIAAGAPAALLDELSRTLLDEDGARLLDEAVASDVSLIAFQALAAQVSTMTALIATLQQQVAELQAGGGGTEPVDSFISYLIASTRAVLDTAQVRRAARAYSWSDAGRVIVASDTPRYDRAGNLLLETANTANLMPNPTMSGFVTTGVGTSGFRLTKPSVVSSPTFRPGIQYDGHTGVVMDIEWDNTAAGATVQRLDLYPAPTSVLKAALVKNKLWTVGVPVALFDGTLPEGVVSYIFVSESGDIALAYNEATVQTGTSNDLKVKPVSQTKLYRCRKKIASANSTTLDACLRTELPAGTSGKASLFIAGEWQMREGRHLGTFAPDGTRPADELDQVLVQGRQGTVVLDIIQPERPADDLPVLRVTPMGTEGSALEVLLAQESWAPCARVVTGGVEQVRTSILNDLPKGLVGRVILSWEDGWLACASEGLPVEWREMVLPAGLAGACTLTLPGFQGSIVQARYYSRAMKAADLRRLSVSGTALPDPDDVTPRAGVSGLGGGVRLQDDPNRSPHLLSPLGGFSLNDLNIPFVKPNGDGTVTYTFGFQVHHAISKNGAGTDIPDNGVMIARMTGPDCVRLRYRGIAIRPGWGVRDNNDSSSGSAIINGPNSPDWEEDGAVRIYWTGQGWCMSATSYDGGDSWVHDNVGMLAAGVPPAVPASASLQQLSGHAGTESRDPAIRDHQGERQLCQGVRNASDGPSIEMFRFTDRLQLGYVGRPVLLQVGKHLPANLAKGDMLECSDFGIEPLSGKMVFLYSKYNSFSLVGDYDWSTGAFAEQSNQSIDRGQSYAAKLWYDRDERLCYHTWINDRGNPVGYTYLSRQAGTMGPPMRLSVGPDNYLSQEFHPDWVSLCRAWSALAASNGVAADFDSQSFALPATGTGDISLDFSEGGVPTLQVRYVRSTNKLTLTFGSTVVGYTSGPDTVKAMLFGATEAVTVEGYRSGSRYLLLFKGASGLAQREMLISTVVQLAVPDTPANELLPLGRPAVAFPNGASLTGIQVAAMDFASADRFTT